MFCKKIKLFARNICKPENIVSVHIFMLSEYDDISTIETFAFFMMVAATKKIMMLGIYLPQFQA